MLTWASNSSSINSVELKQQIEQIVLVFKRLMFSGGLQINLDTCHESKIVQAYVKIISFE